MGYGDDIAPAVRADPFPATLAHPNHVAMLFVAFTDWDVIKLRWTVGEDSSGYLEIPGGAHGSTDYSFEPARPDAVYRFTAQGCNKAADGSTNYCSPVSDPYVVTAAHNTNSLRQFLTESGIDLSKGILLSNVLWSSPQVSSLRALMGIL